MIPEHSHSKQIPLSGLLGRNRVLAQAWEEGSDKHLWSNEVQRGSGTVQVKSFYTSVDLHPQL